MSFPDDYEDEMGRLGRLSDRELEQLAAGRTPPGDDSLEDLAARLSSIRAACVAAPDEVTEALHIAEIIQMAQLLAESGEPVAATSKAIGPAEQASGSSKWRRRLEVARSTAIKLTAGVAAAMLSTLGLAYAGVDLPGEAAEKAFGVVGVELPNQAGGEVVIMSEGPDESHADDTALDVWAVISNWVGDFDCSFGQAVADAATGGENAPDCAAAEGAGSQGDDASAEGRATADEASADGTSAANEASGAGAETGDTASEKGQGNNPSSGSGSGTETGDSASEDGQGNNPSSGSESGQETGDEVSGDGQSNNPTDSGRP